MFSTYFFIAGFGLVAANPLLQRIPIPGQYPVQACPTCPTQTCPSQTCPTSRPPCQTCQNSYQNVYNPQPILVQPSNNCPCNKPVTVPNPVNPTQDALSQLVIRRLLSPQPQTQVSPLPKPCNYCEAQKNVPNIINNYIIVPPEYFKANESKVNNEEPVKRRKKGKRRKQSRHKNPKSATCPCENNDKVNNDKVTVREDVTPCPCDSQNTSQAINSTRIETGTSFKLSKTVDEKSLPQSETDSKVTTISENSKQLNKHQEVPVKTTHAENNPVESKESKRTSLERTNSLEDAIIRDFCKKHPRVPEEIARTLLKKLIHQAETEEKLPYSSYPMSPFSYGHYDPQMFYPRIDEYSMRYSDRFATERKSRKRKPPRPGRRNRKPKEEINEKNYGPDKISQKQVEMKPTVINIETETITNEKITATTEKKLKENLTLNDSETQMETPDDLLKQLDQMKATFAKLNEIETTTVSYKRIEQYPELGKEDKVPTVYNNGVDDYYPDFRGDNYAFASDEDCDSKEEKFELISDNNEGFDSKRYVNTKKQNHTPRKDESSTEQSIPVSTESYESYESMKDDNEEPRFIIPPHLELPDFETKQINKYDKNYFLADDFDAQSNKPEIELKPAKVFTKDKSGRTNIETVYGHSRVVKYGHDAETAASEPVITYYLPEESMTEDHIQLPDGDGIIVVAKSIRDLEDDWE